MQTFLPFSNFLLSSKVLTRLHLGKQRVEAWQILQTLTGKSQGWRRHPAVRMWIGYEAALIEYGITMCNTWIARGYKDTLRDRFYAYCPINMTSVIMPHWLGNIDFHESHRSNLSRKVPEYYSKLWPDTPHNLPYVWPVSN